MLFNSFSFLLCFLPLTLAGYFLVARLGLKYAASFLCFASIIFYGWNEPRFIPFLILSILGNYILGFFIQKYAEKASISQSLLIAGIVANIGVLIYYKYLHDVMTFAHHAAMLDMPIWGSVVLPLGISFYTFTQIGFLIDSRAGITKDHGFLDYCLFVSFFPHLIAGPIVHHREIMPQFANPTTYAFNLDNFSVGFSIFTIGLFKKVLFADSFAPFADAAFTHAHDLTRIEAWCGSFSYFFQLYFDFSGYSEMALGLARMFNIHFPANFDSPYKALSIIDYWQRFHMSLTRYINLYLFNPLALTMTRASIAKKLPVNAAVLKTPSAFVTMVALPTLVTMTIAGIWHGSGLQYLVFGALHGLYLTINHLWRVWHPVAKQNKHSIHHIASVLWKGGLTTLCVLLAQIFFRSTSVADAIAIVKAMTFHPADGHIHILSTNARGFLEDMYRLVAFRKSDLLMAKLDPYQTRQLISLTASFPFVWFLPNVLQLFQNYQPSLSKLQSKPALVNLQWSPSIGWGLWIGFLFFWSIMAMTGTSVFLYFQF